MIRAPIRFQSEICIDCRIYRMIITDEGLRRYYLIEDDISIPVDDYELQRRITGKVFEDLY